MTTRRRSTLALLALALCVSARAAEYQGRGPVGPVVTPAQASAVTRAPALPGAALRLAAPSLSAGLPAAANLSAPVAPGAFNLPAVAPAAAASASAGVPSAAAALPSAAAPVAAAGAPLSAAAGDDKKGPAGRASAERRLTGTRKDLAPELEAASRGEGDPKATGEEIQRVLAGEASRRDAPLAVSSYSGFLPSAIAHRLPNPAQLYPLARRLAVERARAWGVPEKSVAFGEVTASLPAGPEREMHFAFYAQVEGGKVKPILVSFKADHMLAPAAPFSSQVRSWDAAMTLDRRLRPELSSDYLFRRGSEAAPDVALQEARRALPTLGAGVSFTLRFEEIPSTGEVDLWYRFYDSRGSEVAVNARTGERVVAHDAETRKTVDHVVGRKTVDLLGSAAVGAALHPLAWSLAAQQGVSAYTAYLGVWLSAMALVAFGALSVSLLGGARLTRVVKVVGLGVIVSPVLVVAFAGLKALAASAGLAAGAGMVKEAPAPASLPDAYARAAQAADAAAKRYKLPEPAFVEARPTERGWVFDFEAGDRTIIAQDDGRGGMSAYAYGARERAPLFVKTAALRLAPSSFALGAKLSPEEGRRYAAARLGNKVSDVSLSLIVVEQERSGDKDLWYVGDDADGRRVMVNARTGAVKDLFTGPARAEIEAAARAAASYKGMPWSATEWSMTLAGYESGLLKKGATQAQLELFRKLTDAAPVKGGRFNPWSGD